MASINENENPSSEERQDIWAELQALRRDTQAFCTEAYRLRTAGAIDGSGNERMRTRQLELERRGEAILKRLSPELEWGSGRESANNGAMDVSQFWTPGGQTLITAENFLQLQGT